MFFDDRKYSWWQLLVVTKISNEKFSMIILVYLELVFGLVFGTNWKIQVRSSSVDREINKLLQFKVNFVFKMMTKFFHVFFKNGFADFFLLAFNVSSQLVSVTENDVKIRPILINSEFVLFIINLLNSRYAYSNLNLEFWHIYCDAVLSTLS